MDLVSKRVNENNRNPGEKSRREMLGEKSRRGNAGK